MKKKIESNKTNRLYKVVRGMTCHVTALSLLYTPMAFAQSSLLQNASGIIEGVGQFAQEMMAQRQMAQQQEQMAQMRASFHPNNQMVPSKLFPNCMVLKARSDFPSGACENVPTVGDMASVNQSMAFRDIADDFDNHIANLLTTNQNSPQPVGLQCIKEAGAKVGEEIQNRINSLEAQITSVQKNIQLFEEQNRKITDQMDVLKGDLYGGAATKKDVNKDFLNQFSPACSTWFGTSANTDARDKGLAGLQTLSSKINEDASNTIANENNMTRDIISQLDGLDKRIKERGIASFSDPSEILTALRMGGSGQSYKVLNDLIADKTNLLVSDVSAITSDLSEVGFNMQLSDFDRNFKNKFADFSKNATTYFKKKAVDDCVTGRDQSLALGLSTQQILDGLKIREVNSNQTTLTSYKDKLLSILSSNAFIDKKLQLIEDLDQEFGVGEVFLTYTDSNGRRTSATTYGLYKDQIAACETKIGNTKGFGLEQSYQVKIERANKALQKAIALEKAFRNDLKQSLYDRVVNCKGIEPNQESCSYADSSVMSNSGDNYCISNAVSCAKQVNTCQAEVHTVVERKQMEMKSLASQFNANVSGVIAQQEILLNQVKMQAIADAEYLKQYFDQSDYVYPEGLFIEMPQEEMHEEYGVALRGKGDLSKIKGLPAQLNKLKKMLQNQKEKVGMSILDYADSQKDGMLAEKKRWSTLAKSCAIVEQEYNKAVAQQQQAMKEQQAATGNFCRKYKKIANSNNPSGVCGQATSLAEDASNISQAVDPDAVDLAQEFINYCDSSQNERSRGSEGESARAPASETGTPTAELISACRREDWDGQEVYARISGRRSLSSEDMGRMLGGFETATFDELTGNVAESYCKSFGNTYTAGADEEAGTCDTATGVNPQPDICSYFQYQAYTLQEGDNSKVALNSFYEKVVAGDSQMEDDEFVKPMAYLYEDYNVSTSPSGNIGEQMRNTPCLAINTNGVGESQADDSDSSRINSIYDVIGQ